MKLAKTAQKISGSATRYDTKLFPIPSYNADLRTRQQPTHVLQLLWWTSSWISMMSSLAPSWKNLETWHRPCRLLTAVMLSTLMILFASFIILLLGSCHQVHRNVSILTLSSRNDLVSEDLLLENMEEVAYNKRRNPPAAKKKKKTSRPAKRTQESGTYHYIAIVPVNNQVWELDGLETKPLCLGTRAPSWPQTQTPTYQFANRTVYNQRGRFVAEDRLRSHPNAYGASA